MTNRLRDEVAGHTLRLDMTFHGRHTPGEMIERVDGDLLGLATMISSFVINAVGRAMVLLGTMVLVWLADLRLDLALTLLVAVGAGSMLLSQREWLQAAEDIRANGVGRHVVRRLHERVADAFRADRRWEVWGGLAISQTELTFALGTVVMLALVRTPIPTRWTRKSSGIWSGTKPRRRTARDRETLHGNSGGETALLLTSAALQQGEGAATEIPGTAFPQQSPGAPQGTPCQRVRSAELAARDAACSLVGSIRMPFSQAAP